jgi:hypothetical protein
MFAAAAPSFLSRALQLIRGVLRADRSVEAMTGRSAIVAVASYGALAAQAAGVTRGHLCGGSK